MINKRVLTGVIVVSVLILAVSSLVEVPANAAKPGTGTKMGTVTITVDSNVGGRLKPVQGAVVTIRGTSLTGTTDRRGQVSFSSTDVISRAGTQVLYWADASYTVAGTTQSGCINFAFASSTASVRSTIILGSCALSAIN